MGPGEGAGDMLVSGGEPRQPTPLSTSQQGSEGNEPGEFIWRFSINFEVWVGGRQRICYE